MANSRLAVFALLASLLPYHKLQHGITSGSRVQPNLKLNRVLKAPERIGDSLNTKSMNKKHT